MPFERFEQTAYSRNMGHKPVVAINKGRMVSFYAAFCREFIPKNSMYVNLYFDRVANKIGFEFIPQEERKPFAKKLSKPSSGGESFWINCRPFLVYAEFNSLERTLFKPQKEGDLITIDLNNPVKLEDL